MFGRGGAGQRDGKNTNCSHLLTNSLASQCEVYNIARDDAISTYRVRGGYSNHGGAQGREGQRE